MSDRCLSKIRPLPWKLIGFKRKKKGPERDRDGCDLAEMFGNKTVEIYFRIKLSSCCWFASVAATVCCSS